MSLLNPVSAQVQRVVADTDLVQVLTVHHVVHPYTTPQPIIAYSDAIGKQHAECSHLLPFSTVPL